VDDWLGSMNSIERAPTPSIVPVEKSSRYYLLGSAT
jgi:hypothetical protein